jgi:hypothetical protein
VGQGQRADLDPQPGDSGSQVEAPFEVFGVVDGEAVTIRAAQAVHARAVHGHRPQAAGRVRVLLPGRVSGFRALGDRDRVDHPEPGVGVGGRARGWGYRGW